MIKIKRDSLGPDIKNASGDSKIEVENKKMFLAFDEDPRAYMKGEKKFSFDSSIYGHDLVKAKLRNTQFGKCAFCESNVTHIDYGDVEHFRPKGGYCQNNDSDIQKPGYYWLAYDWNNLIFSCTLCNRRYKKNLFPLRNPEIRALNHNQTAKLKSEKPFFVNPATENPKFLIHFDNATAKGIDRNYRGKKTIDCLGLNRQGDEGISELYEMRLSHFNLVEMTYFIAKSSPSAHLSEERIEKAKNLMASYRNPKSQYSAMINDNFPLLKRY